MQRTVSGYRIVGIIQDAQSGRWEEIPDPITPETVWRYDLDALSELSAVAGGDIIPLDQALRDEGCIRAGVQDISPNLSMPRNYVFVIYAGAHGANAEISYAGIGEIQVPKNFWVNM